MIKESNKDVVKKAGALTAYFGWATIALAAFLLIVFWALDVLL